MGVRVQHRPTFLWQTILILLPVFILALVGLFSIRQDQQIAQREAIDRAALIAESLLPEIWGDLTLTQNQAFSTYRVFEVTESGGLVFPPPYEPVPVPLPLDLAQLNGPQAQLWAGLDAPGAEMNPDHCERFLELNPPDRFAAMARYRCGVALVQQRKMQEAAEMFAAVANRHPQALGESGLPLRPLALFRLRELSPSIDGSIVNVKVPSYAQNAAPEFEQSAPWPNFLSVESLSSNVVMEPSALTAFILDGLVRRADEHELIRQGKLPIPSARAAPLFRLHDPPPEEGARPWQALWREHEFTRALHARARWQLTNGNYRSEVFWFHAPAGFEVPLPIVDDYEPALVREKNWLAVRVARTESTSSFLCYGESEVEVAISRLLNSRQVIPDYFGATVDIGGRRINSFGHGSGNREPSWVVARAVDHPAWSTIVASARRGELLTVNMYLTDPARFFARQRTRTLWFGALVLLSAIAALAGLLAARRGFRRQLQLSEMKSNFVSSVSHELRAPIASVRLMAESLERGKIADVPRQKEYFRFIGQECRRLSSLIENVLDFSRIEQGRKQYEFEPTDLPALARETVRVMEPYAEEKGVRLMLNSQLQTHNSELDIDGRALQQALVNLIDNAIKHSPRGETVAIKLEASDSVESKVDPLNHHPAAVKLSVSDNGPGIPPQEHAKIFERFYRLGTELRRETQGVGIGLSIVKHIVEAHGGRVLVQSTVGQGSQFTIELPAKHSPANKHG